MGKNRILLDSIAASVFADIFIELTNTNTVSEGKIQITILILRRGALFRHCYPMPHQAKLRGETWRCMEELQEQGVLRSIGVSNYDSTLLYEVVLLGGTRPQVISLICRWWFPTWAEGLEGLGPLPTKKNNYEPPTPNNPAPPTPHKPTRPTKTTRE